MIWVKQIFPGCKRGAFVKLHLVVYQVHFPVHLPCYDLPLLKCDVWLGTNKVLSKRVTGGVYASQSRVKKNTLVSFYY